MNELFSSLLQMDFVMLNKVYKTSMVSRFYFLKLFLLFVTISAIAQYIKLTFHLLPLDSLWFIFSMPGN